MWKQHGIHGWLTQISIWKSGLCTACMFLIAKQKKVQAFNCMMTGFVNKKIRVLYGNCCKFPTVQYMLLPCKHSSTHIQFRKLMYLMLLHKYAYLKENSKEGPNANNWEGSWEQTGIAAIFSRSFCVWCIPNEFKNLQCKNTKEAKGHASGTGMYLKYMYVRSNEHKSSSPS